MVLTQRQGRGEEKCPGVLVSIPLWFSRNIGKESETRLRNKFPYHYGSHATRLQRDQATITFFVSIPLWFSRNDRKRCIPIQGKLVSIPLWFSRNSEKRYKRLSNKPPFPYHYGSHATPIGRANFPPTIICFHTTMVLTQRPSGYRLQGRNN